MVPSSARHTAPSSVYRPPASQSARMMEGLDTCAATRPGARRMPMPSVLPTMTARPNANPRTRLRLWLEGDEDRIDGLTEVARRVARADRLELDVARLPSVHDRLAVGGVLDLAAREMHDDGVGAVRVKRFARSD